MGHIKCGHSDLKRKAYAVLSAIQGIDAAVVPDRYQNLLPLLALGRLLTWCRESEFLADRAGLLCCGEPKAAYEAIMRLQHGLRADSPWIDPYAKGFDPQAVIRNFQDWQYQPFVKFIRNRSGAYLQHDLASCVSSLTLIVRLAGTFERERPAQYWPESALISELAEKR